MNKEIFAYSFEKDFYFSLEADFAESSYDTREEFLEALQENAAVFLDGFISTEGIVYETLPDGSSKPAVKYYVEEKDSLLKKAKRKTCHTKMN